MKTQEIYIKQIQQELKKTPVEYLPALLNIIHSYRESIYFKSFDNLRGVTQQKTFDDLFGILTADHSVSLEKMEETISLKAQERFNDSH